MMYEHRNDTFFLFFKKKDDVGFWLVNLLTVAIHLCN